MFRKNKDRNQEPPFQRNAEYSLLPEDSKREIEQNESGMKVTSARLSSGTEIKGSIKFDGILRIDGNVNGEISTDNGKLVVSESGVVNAVITAKSVVIEGRVKGNIIASDKVELMQNAHLIGDLQAKILVIEDGVVFVGRCNVNP